MPPVRVHANPSEPAKRHLDEPVPVVASADREQCRDRLDRETVITRHLPLVEYVARSMTRVARASSVVDYEDLLGHGAEGLIDAVDSYDSSFNVQFRSWAMLHIRTTIQDALRRLDPLPRSLRAKSREIEQVRITLASRNGAWPADVEIAAQLGISVARLQHLERDINRTAVSLDQSHEQNNGNPYLNWLAFLVETDPEADPESHLDAIEMPLILGQAIESLPDRERTVIVLYYGQSQDMRTIGARLNISESRVSQLRSRAVKLLRVEMDRMLAVSAD